MRELVNPNIQGKMNALIDFGKLHFGEDFLINKSYECARKRGLFIHVCRYHKMPWRYIFVSMGFHCDTVMARYRDIRNAMEIYPEVKQQYAEALVASIRHLKFNEPVPTTRELSYNEAEGRKLHIMRIECGLSSDNACKLAKIKRGTLSAIESGYRLPEVLKDKLIAIYQDHLNKIKNGKASEHIKGNS